MTRTERLALIERDCADLSLTTQTSLLSLNRTSVYYQPVPPTAEELDIKHRIDEIYTDHPVYGVRRITAVLRREGRGINHKAVARHMREMGIHAIYPGPNLSKQAHRAAIAPYLLAHVTATAPNHVWGSDITYIRLRTGWMYLVVVLDWYARYIVSWALDQTLAMPFVLDAVDSALAHATPRIWNTDQGSHFTSPLYTQRLTAAGVQISMDGRGRALDNIFTERLWRTIKYEEVYLHDYATPRDARARLHAFIDHYNHARPHQALGYATPAEIYQQGPGSAMTAAPPQPDA